VRNQDASTHWTGSVAGVVGAIDLYGEPGDDAVVVKDVVTCAKLCDDIVCGVGCFGGLADVTFGVVGLEIVSGHAIGPHGDLVCL